MKIKLERVKELIDTINYDIDRYFPIKKYLGIHDDIVSMLKSNEENRIKVKNIKEFLISGCKYKHMITFDYETRYMPNVFLLYDDEIEEVIKELEIVSTRENIEKCIAIYKIQNS